MDRHELTMRILSIFTAALVLAGSLAAQTVQDMHRMVVARKNVEVAPPSGISFVEAVVSPHSSTRSPVVTHPATATTNDVWIVVMSSDVVLNYDGTPPTGWSKIAEHDGGFETVTAFWRRADGSEGASSTWTNILSTNSAGMITLLVYRGCEQTGDPQSGTAAGETGAFGSAKDVAMTTTDNYAMVVAVIAADTNTTFTWDGGITERIDSDTTPSGRNATTSEMQMIGDRIVATAGAASLGGDAAGSFQNAELILALKPE
jgi:hypothetical protein